MAHFHEVVIQEIDGAYVRASHSKSWKSDAVTAPGRANLQPIDHADERIAYLGIDLTKVRVEAPSAPFAARPSATFLWADARVFPS